MQLVDTHAHVNMHRFKDDASEVMQRSLESGVIVINVGTRIETSQEAVALLEQYPENVYAVVGLHPSHTFDAHHDEQELAEAVGVEQFDYETYKTLASKPRVVGIGECGLDYYRLPESDVEEIKAEQRPVFEQHIKLALELDRALVIHCRPSKGNTDAYDDCLQILRQHTNGLRFEVHSFTGPLEIAQHIVELGGYLGLNGIITFDKTGESERVVKNIPLESIVLETDSPYLAPLPYRGQRNEPSYVVEVAKKIAEWKNESVEKVAEVTTSNAQQLFKL